MTLLENIYVWYFQVCSLWFHANVVGVLDPPSRAYLGGTELVSILRPGAADVSGDLVSWKPLQEDLCHVMCRAVSCHVISHGATCGEGEISEIGTRERGRERETDL